MDIRVEYPPTPPAPVTALRTLPRDIPAFTGRRTEVDQLLAAAQASRVVTIHTIDGMPGVGKTALAIHAAHRLADRYPDAQLFVGLHAHSSGHSPADPADVLAALLLGIGLAPQNIPQDVDARAALWRDRLAGKRMLLVLDDAASRTQVEPLLPGTEDCLVLVTSRRRLVALDGAIPMPLTPLAPEDAALLFTRLAHRSTLTSDESVAVERMVKLCGNLPLAIALLAGRFAHHPHWDLTQYAQEFAETQDRLDELVTDDRAVAAAFEMSYRNLPLERQQLFRRLGLHPGPDTDAYATAALADMPLPQARRELEALYADHLVDASVPGRYSLHDLLRAYARTLVAEFDPVGQRDAATERLLNYYQQTAEAADRHLSEIPRPVTPAASVAPGFTTHQQAMTWMRAERPNLIACTYHASATAQHSHAIRLTAALAVFLRQQGPWDEAITLHQTAASTARYIGDRIGEAGALRDLGRARAVTGNFRAAADLLEQALDLYRALGNRLGEAGALWDLGRVRYVTGNFPAAADLEQQALVLYRALGNRLGEAGALWDLGRVRYVTGDYPAAADLLQQALDLYRAFGNRLGEAGALWDLGRVRYMTGDYPAAADLDQQALDLHRALGNRLGEAGALWDLGRARAVIGDLSMAADLLQQALDLYRSLGNRHGEANALHDLGRVWTETGDYLVATDLLQQSLIRFRGVGDTQGEAEVLNSTGALLAASANPGAALPMYQQALVLADQVQSPLDKAHALEGIARCHSSAGNQRAALVNLREAVSIYQRIGSAEASSAAAYLTQLQAVPLEADPISEPTDR